MREAEIPNHELVKPKPIPSTDHTEKVLFNSPFWAIEDVESLSLSLSDSLPIGKSDERAFSKDMMNEKWLEFKKSRRQRKKKVRLTAQILSTHSMQLERSLTRLIVHQRLEVYLQKRGMDLLEIFR